VPVTIRVLIADDQAMVRTGFRMVLAGEPDIAVVGEVAGGEEAVRKASELRPDVTLMDIRMPGLDGIEATRLLAGRHVAQPLRVVVVTTFDTDENVYTALRAGAVGFLLKDAKPSLLVDAVRTAALGESLISPTVLVRLLRQWSAGAGRAHARTVESLTRREVEIVRAVARGHTNGEVAAELGVSLATVKTHLMAAQRKIGARNRTETAIWAWENGHVR
jgi:DNA-binding NarL/FixJ family response regulator